MVPRIAAATLGLIAGVAAVLVLALDWSTAVAWLGIEKPAILAALAAPLPRLAWIIVLSISVFATVALLIALAAGFVETLVARSRIDALRHDPMLVGRWNATDWRAAFAHTAVAERAEAIVAALLPTINAADGVSDRRVFADPALLVDLDRVWLDRMALSRTISPLPPLLLGVGGALALFHYVSGEPGWEVALAAGVSGWLYVGALRYFVLLILGPAVELVVRAATAAVRPLTSTLSLELIAARVGQRAPGTPTVIVETLPPEQAGTAVAALGTALPPLIERLGDAADRLGAAGSGLAGQLAQQITEIASRAGEAGGAAAAAPLATIAEGIRGAVQQREQAIESALAEVRAGIEALLSEQGGNGAAVSSDLADTLRRTSGEQGETLRQATAELRGGIEAAAGSLQATLAAIETTERQNATMLAGLLHAIEARSQSGGPSALQALPPVTGESNAAVADALRNLLRDFDEG